MLRRRCSTLAGIEELRSRSEAEQATFQIQFDWGRDIDAAAFDVRTKLDAIRSELPAGADRILAFSFNASDQPVVVVRISADQDLTDQYDSLERYLKRPLERVPGVARVELQGVVPREVRILINAGRMAAHNIDVQRLATLLQKSNFSVSAGEITEQGQRFSIRPIGEFRSLDDIRNLRVASAVRLSDIADVDAGRSRARDGPAPRQPPGRRPGRLQDDAGERGRNGRCRAQGDRARPEHCRSSRASASS